MTPPPAHNISSEPSWVEIKDGSDREWRLISMYELRKLEHAINEECVGKTDSCPPGHLKEMHDSGNETIDKVRSRPYTSVGRNLCTTCRIPYRSGGLPCAWFATIDIDQMEVGSPQVIVVKCEHYQEIELRQQKERAQQ
jgi:hypothetical protein